MNQNLANAQAVRFLAELGLSDYKLNVDYVVIPEGMGYAPLEWGEPEPNFPRRHFSPSHQRGATYIGGSGVISPGNNQFDIYTSNSKMVDEAYKIMEKQIPFEPLSPLSVKFYKGGKDVWFESQTLNENFEKMWQKNYDEYHAQQKNDEAVRLSKNQEKAKLLLEKFGLKGFEEGKNYIILQEGDGYRHYDNIKKKTSDETGIHLPLLGYKKDGHTRSCYNGGAMVLFDGQSDFIILTTDPDMMDQVKNFDHSGWVPCYNAGREAVFTDARLEKQFSEMINLSDKKEAERKKQKEAEEQAAFDKAFADKIKGFEL